MENYNIWHAYLAGQFSGEVYLGCFAIHHTRNEAFAELEAFFLFWRPVFDSVDGFIFVELDNLHQGENIRQVKKRYKGIRTIDNII